MNNDSNLKSYFSDFDPELADNKFMELLSVKLNILDQVQIQQQKAKREMSIRLITTLCLGIIAALIITICSWGVPSDIYKLSNFEGIQLATFIREITYTEIVSLVVATSITLIGITLHYLFTLHNLKHIRILNSQIKHITQTL